MSEFDIKKWESNFGEMTQDIYQSLQNHDIDISDVLKPLDFEKNGEENFNYHFNHKLSSAIIEAGYDGDPEDTYAKALFLTKRLENIGEKIDGQTIRSWLKAERIPLNTENSRHNALHICFALNMTLEQSIDFMQNALFIRAFNFRNPTECIAYFALKHKYDWNWVKKVDCEIKDDRKSCSDTNDLQSTEIAEGLSQLETVDELKEYLLHNVPETDESLRRAKQLVRDLVKRAQKNAKTENEAYEDAIKGLSKNSNAFLLRTIYGRGTRITDVKKYKKYMKTKAHPLVVTNFPLEQEFSVLLSDDKNPSSDLLRKTIILLIFYNSFVNFTPYNKPSKKYFYRFVEETQKALEECCLPLLHPKNPYDRIFLYCACYDDEFDYATLYLDNFRDIVDEMMPEI